MKTLTGGIIGCGVISPSHLGAYRNLENVKIKYLCDLVIGKAEKLGKQFEDDFIYTTDFMDVLRDPEVDFISICTDHASHNVIAVTALEHGKHILCEKVLDAHPEGVERMLKAHASHPELVAMGIFQHRYEPINVEFRQMLQDGILGRIVGASLNVNAKRNREYYQSDAWRGTQQYEGGGILINQAIHELDLLRYFLGEVAEVAAFSDNLEHQDCIEVEDTVSAALRFESGALASLTASSSSIHPWRHQMIIMGTEGTVEFNGDELAKISLIDKEKEKIAGERLSAIKKVKIDSATRKKYYGGSHKLEIEAFIGHIRGENVHCIAPLEDAARTAKLIFACYESSRNKSFVTL